MNIMELKFQEELKKQVNEKIQDLDATISDELAPIYLILTELNINEKDFNTIIDKINNVKKHCQHALIK